MSRKLENLKRQVEIIDEKVRKLYFRRSEIEAEILELERTAVTPEVKVDEWVQELQPKADDIPTPSSFAEACATIAMEAMGTNTAATVPQAHRTLSEIRRANRDRQTQSVDPASFFSE